MRAHKIFPDSMINNILRELDYIKYIFATLYFTLLRQPFIIKLFRVNYRRCQNRIEIDLTYECQLRCFNCNRSCRQAPTEEKMTVGQIRKFIEESIADKIRWERIRLTGGEPALHPDIFEILKLLLEYKKSFSPKTDIQFVTNGAGAVINGILKQLPAEVRIINSAKKSPFQLFSPFNLAPLDNRRYRAKDYSVGCVNYSKCGMGLTPFGYYCCAVAGGIDRIFGFNIGRKRLPRENDSMNDHLQVFCKLCGIFGHFRLTRKELVSPTWKSAYENYRKKKTNLTLY